MVKGTVGFMVDYCLPNVPDQRRRATDARLETETQSQGSLHPVCSAGKVSRLLLASEPLLQSVLDQSEHLHVAAECKQYRLCVECSGAFMRFSDGHKSQVHTLRRNDPNLVT